MFDASRRGDIRMRTHPVPLSEPVRAAQLQFRCLFPFRKVHVSSRMVREQEPDKVMICKHALDTILETVRIQIETVETFNLITINNSNLLK